MSAQPLKGQFGIGAMPMTRKASPQAQLTEALDAMLQQRCGYLPGKVDVADLARRIVASTQTPADAVDALISISSRSGASSGSAVDALRRQTLTFSHQPASH